MESHEHLFSRNTECLGKGIDGVDGDIAVSLLDAGDVGLFFTDEACQLALGETLFHAQAGEREFLFRDFGCQTFPGISQCLGGFGVFFPVGYQVVDVDEPAFTGTVGYRCLHSLGGSV